MDMNRIHPSAELLVSCKPKRRLTWCCYSCCCCSCCCCCCCCCCGCSCCCFFCCCCCCCCCHYCIILSHSVLYIFWHFSFISWYWSGIQSCTSTSKLHRSTSVFCGETEQRLNCCVPCLQFVAAISTPSKWYLTPATTWEVTLAPMPALRIYKSLLLAFPM